MPALAGSCCIWGGDPVLAAILTPRLLSRPYHKKIVLRAFGRYGPLPRVPVSPKPYRTCGLGSFASVNSALAAIEYCKVV